MIMNEYAADDLRGATIVPQIGAGKKREADAANIVCHSKPLSSE